MANSTKYQLREIWFQVHKWIGLALAIVIIPICLTGSALVWKDAIDDWNHPQRHAEAVPNLPPTTYAAAAVVNAPQGQSLVSLAFPRDEGAVVATLAAPPRPGGGRPIRTTLYLDPQDARLLDRTATTGGWMSLFHSLHGTLMIPGVGRAIVGWIGVAMLLSSLTGLWLWWPFKGGLRRGMRWKRAPDLSVNLHHQGGFWIALPLAALSLTGVWISFPAFFSALSGDRVAPRAAPTKPLTETRLTPEDAVRLSGTVGDGLPSTISWPTAPSYEWKIGYRGAGAVAVNDRSGLVTPPAPPPPETTARLMRRIHDGDGMGIVWQVIVFLGGLVPAALAVTGVLMWWNTRVRGAAMSRRHEKRRGDLSGPGPVDLDASGASL